MRYLFVTVAQDAPRSLGDLEALIDSIARQDVESEMVLVLRGGGALRLSLPDNLHVHIVPAPDSIPLSHARNLALARVGELDLLATSDIVGFPDDDCRYPDGALARAELAFTQGADLVSGPYRPRNVAVDRHRFPSEPTALTPSFVMRVVSSNNVLMRAPVIAAVGAFDERFGLGARFGASEDSDYVIRALAHGFRGRYLPEFVVEHPYKAHRPAEYYVGNLAVLAKHALGGRTLTSMLYRLVVGAWWAAKSRLPVGIFARGVIAAAEMLFAARGEVRNV